MYNLVYFVIIIAGISLIGVITRFLVKKKLSESNSILWIFIGLVIILSGVFPKAVVKLSNLFYITYPPAFVFMMAIVILLFIVFKNTIDISLLTAKMQETAAETSILKHQINELRKQLEEQRHNDYKEKRSESD